MVQSEFLKKMEDILEEDNLSMETVLLDLDTWDSLSVVSFVSMANAFCGKKLSAREVLAAKTLKDLYALLG